MSKTGVALVYSENGDPLKVLRAVEYPVKEPEDNEVLLKLLATPINPSDKLQIDGTYARQPPKDNEVDKNTPSCIAGIEGCFEVVKVGSKVTNCKIGDWVLPPRGKSTWRTNITVDSALVFALPDKTGLTPLQVATITVNPCTADIMLSRHVEKGDWFIQNGGNSGLGRVAIQLAKLKGLKSISVIRDRPDAEELKKELKGLGADVVITEKEAASPTTVQQLAGGAQPKLALDCIGGQSSTHLAQALAEGGYLVCYGSMTGEPVPLSSWLFVFKDIHVEGFWLTKWAKETGKLPEVIVKLLGYIRDGKLKDTHYTTHKYDASRPSEELLKAYQAAIENDNNRKGKQAVLVE